MSLDGVGVVDYQLFLLKTMRPPAERLDAALQQLGCTEQVMIERSEVVSRLTKWTLGRSGNIGLILSDALVSGSCEKTGVYRLPLWPELDFVVSPANLAFWQSTFAKRPDGQTADRVLPWEFMENDLSDRFGETTEVDAWGHHATYLAQDRSDGQRYFLRFGWGLLQEIEAA